MVDRVGNVYSSSHGDGRSLIQGVVWVCVAALALLDRLDEVDRDQLGSWLSERQLPNGGLNGRPEKLEDVSQQISSFELRVDSHLACHTTYMCAWASYGVCADPTYRSATRGGISRR